MKRRRAPRRRSWSPTASPVPKQPAQPATWDSPNCPRTPPRFDLLQIAKQRLGHPVPADRTSSHLAAGRGDGSGATTVDPRLRRWSRHTKRRRVSKQVRLGRGAGARSRSGGDECGLHLDARQRQRFDSGWEGSCLGWIGPQSQMGHNLMDLSGQIGVTPQPTEANIEQSCGFSVVYPERQRVSGSATEAPGPAF
jgi:hypothetical protein